jgi:hypothetical protein
VGKISCTAVTLLVLASSGFTQTAAAVLRPRPGVTISVYDYAHVSAERLQAAEDEAGRIFRQAGVQTFWVNCLPKPEGIESHGCYIVDTTHLMLKILPHAISTQVRDRTHVLGDALVDEKGSAITLMLFTTVFKRSLKSTGWATLCWVTCWLTKLGTCCWDRNLIP